MRRTFCLVMFAGLVVVGLAHAQTPPTAAPTPAPAPSQPATPAAAPPAQGAAQAAAQVPGTEGFVWAEGCKSCHEEIYEAWAKTKHARTLGRLSAEERQAGSQCVGCHVTGPKTPVEVSGTVVNANVQCESCHGAGKAHVEAATAGDASKARLVKSPPQRLCETCHNDKSPHYRGFFFAALKGLVHKK